MCGYSVLTCLMLNIALGKAEVQLRLVDEGMFSGNSGLIDFLAKGLSIQESQ